MLLGLEEPLAVSAFELSGSKVVDYAASLA